MNTIQFSVVIPLYNKVESVCRTLNSLRQQRLLPAEIIVVDDGSTDGSAETVSALNMPNVKLVQQTNKGVSFARNYGVSLAKHEHIAFIDADDQWSPFYLLEMSKLIARFPEYEFFASNYQKVCEGNTYIDPKLAIGHIPPQGNILHDYFDVVANGDLPFMVSSTVITRRLFKELGGFPVGECMGEDQELFCQAALRSSIVYSPLVLLKYHTDSENRACDRHLPDDVLPFAKRLLALAETGFTEENFKKSVLTCCAAHVFHLAKSNLRAGNLAIARQLLKQPCCKLKPLHFISFNFWLVSKLILSPQAYLTQFRSLSAHIYSKY
jgi:glycosyltransferase involved in cell wall biosynthesis